MATYLSPGVYVEEIATGPKPIAGVPTSVAAIVGKTEKGPLLDPQRLTDWNAYLAEFGAPIAGSYTAESAFGFFENGGTALWVVRADNAALSEWRAVDGTGADAFAVEASSPGGWSANMELQVGQEAGGGKGLLYVAKVTVPTGGLSLSAGTQREIAVDTTLGATAGMSVVLLDTAGAGVQATVDAVGSGTLKVTPITGAPATTFSAGADVRVAGRAENGATTIPLAVGSAFQPGDLVRAQGPTGAPQTAVVQQADSIGAGAMLTLSSALSGSVNGLQFAARVVALPAAITATGTSGGKTTVAPAGLTYVGGDPGLAQTDLVRLVTEHGIEAPWTGSVSAFLFPVALASAPKMAQVYAKVSVTPWREDVAIEIPTTATAADVTSILEARFPFIPPGAKLRLTKAAGGQNFTRGSTGTWTTEGGVGNAPGSYTSAAMVLDTAQGLDATKGLLVQGPVAPRAGDYVDIGTVGKARIKDVTQDPGMAANAWRLTFDANFTANPTGASWGLFSWQPTTFETLRFSLTAVNAPATGPAVTESFTGLSLNQAHPRYYLADGVINGRSTLIRVTDRLAATALSSTDSLPRTANQVRTGSAGTLDVGRFRAGFEALERTTEPMLVAGPDALTLGDDMSRSAALNAMIVHCEEHRQFAVVDLPDEPDDEQLLDWRLLHLDSTHAAGYAPFLRMLTLRPDAIEQTVDVPPSGFVMGVYARTDNDRGVWKAPANEQVRGIVDLAVPYTQRRQDLLNPKGVNLIRSFPGRGMRIWGARNLTDDTTWRYVNVRRLFLFLESSIELGTQWVVFEPNEATTWLRVRVSVENFVNQIWRAGGLAGATPEQAYRVRCGLGQTMTETDVELGLLVIEVAVAPVYPAEFVVFRISHKRLTE